MNKIRNNLFYLMGPDEIYKKYGRFKGLGNAYAEFSQFGGSKEISAKQELLRYSTHRRPIDPEEEKKKLQSEIEDYNQSKHLLGTSAIPTIPGEEREKNSTLIENQEEEIKKNIIPESMEVIKQEAKELREQPEEEKIQETPAVKVKKNQRTFRLNQSKSKYLDLVNSRVTNPERFQRHSSAANLTGYKLKSIANFIKCILLI